MSHDCGIAGCPGPPEWKPEEHWHEEWDLTHVHAGEPGHQHGMCQVPIGPPWRLKDQELCLEPTSGPGVTMCYDHDGPPIDPRWAASDQDDADADEGEDLWETSTERPPTS